MHVAYAIAPHSPSYESTVVELFCSLSFLAYYVEAHCQCQPLPREQGAVLQIRGKADEAGTKTVTGGVVFDLDVTGKGLQVQR